MKLPSLILAMGLGFTQQVSLDLKDVDLRDFFLMMAETANMNVLVHPAVEGKVTLKVQGVSWDTLLDMVLKNHSLGKEVEGNMMRIAPLTVLEAEYKQRAAIELARLNALRLQTHIYILNYARAESVALIISKMLSPRGSVVADSRRNALIVTDVVTDRMKRNSQ